MRSRRNQTSSVALIVPIVVQRSPKLTLVYVAAMVDVEGVKGGRNTRGHWVGVVTPLAAYHARLDRQPSGPPLDLERLTYAIPLLLARFCSYLVQEDVGGEHARAPLVEALLDCRVEGTSVRAHVPASGGTRSTARGDVLLLLICRWFSWRRLGRRFGRALWRHWKLSVGRDAHRVRLISLGLAAGFLERMDGRDVCHPLGFSAPQRSRRTQIAPPPLPPPGSPEPLRNPPLRGDSCEPFFFSRNQASLLACLLSLLHETKRSSHIVLGQAPTEAQLASNERPSLTSSSRRVAHRVRRLCPKKCPFGVRGRRSEFTSGNV